MNGFPARRLLLWMKRAINSLPVPLSPEIKTVESVTATRWLMLRIFSITGWEPFTNWLSMPLLVARQKNNNLPSRTQVGICVGADRRVMTSKLWRTGMRSDGRKLAELRRVKISTDFIRHAEGSVLIEVGDTRVICTATVEEGVPPFLRDTNRGWVTAEYGMLPGCSTTRLQRES